MNQWIAPKEPVWILRNTTFTKAVVESINKDTVICLLEDGTYAQTKKPQLFQRDPLHNSFNKDKFDLMDTDLLNEPQILSTLKFRLEHQRIYTFIENSIISVNPYTSIPGLYLDKLKDFYIQSIIEQDQNPRDFEPHLYSVAGQMIGELRRTQVDQAVIISGESGAGKTEANKQCLRFLLHYFHSCSGTLDRQVQAVLSLSNPVLQAFGNSKTIRNNNSSRFGKYLNISLNDALEIKEVKIYNYLLEKSRIISRADNQQNFHIFYELLEGLTAEEKKRYFLCSSQGRPYSIQDFNYLKNKYNQYQRHPEVSFEQVKTSLITLEKEDAYDLACRVLAAILLLGNLTPFQSDNEDCCKVANPEVMAQICALLQVQEKRLVNALTCYPLKIGSETLVKYFNCRQAQELINSLAKILYERLFLWIITQINSLSHHQQPSGSSQLKHLGFLDIYGFEILEQNSLEQLFINYTNERLHQIYLSKIFKEEEQLFKAEGLGHKFKEIPFEDNLAVLELIDFEQLSIFNLLDEWCSVASPDDSSFITKIRHKHKKHPKFTPHNFNLPSTMFAIAHSPKEIEYTVLGFRDKNRDLVIEEIKVAVRSSSLSSLQSMFQENRQQGDAKSNHKYKRFLSSKFRHEINNLVVDLIGRSNLHFIRCVKSNSLKAALQMDDEVVYNQICYLGILDTIKLKKVGYCLKLKYEALDRRYPWLLRDQKAAPGGKEAVIRHLTRFLPNYSEEDMLFGQSMVFFKDYAFAALNKKYQLYLQALNKKATMVQKRIFSFLHQQKLNKVKKGRAVLSTYLHTLLQHRKYCSIMEGLVCLQRKMRLKLNALKKAKRIKNILVLQAYIKKSVCKRKKDRVFDALQKIINLIKRYQLRKNVQKFAVVHMTRQWIIDGVWKAIELRRKSIVETYLQGFLVQIGQKNQIVTANLNTHKKFEQKYLAALASYLHGFALAAQHEGVISKVRKMQRVLCSWLCRQRFLKLRKAAIVIQRAYRQYYFNKNTARQIFDLNFGQYQGQLQAQNQSIRSVLYQNSLQNSLKLLYHNYLSKYHEKCSVLYMVVDFEAFVTMELCYPGNGWLLNYFQVVKESLERDNPIQGLQVGETFSVAATTNRLYVWGMNHELGSDQNMVMVKPPANSRIDRYDITKNSLEITYQTTTKAAKEPKQIPKTVATTSKQYVIQNAKIFECRAGSLKLVKIPNNERVAEVACGANHVILRTSAKKVYTFGSGKHGQLGHNNYHSCQAPKMVEFPQGKHYAPVQVSASFNSSLLLLSNRKIYWWGSNASIDKVASPALLELGSKLQQLGSGNFVPLRIKSSWTRSMSVVGVTLLHCQGKLAGSIPLRNKIADLMIGKWHQMDIASVNPPYYPAFSDYLEECHVKMPTPQVVIEPESKRTLKRLEEKVGSIQTDRVQFSFSQNQK